MVMEAGAFIMWRPPGWWSKCESYKLLQGFLDRSIVDQQVRLGEVTLLARRCERSRLIGAISDYKEDDGTAHITQGQPTTLCEVRECRTSAPLTPPRERPRSRMPLRVSTAPLSNTARAW